MVRPSQTTPFMRREEGSDELMVANPQQKPGLHSAGLEHFSALIYALCGNVSISQPAITVYKI